MRPLLRISKIDERILGNFPKKSIEENPSLRPKTVDKRPKTNVAGLWSLVFSLYNSHNSLTENKLCCLRGKVLDRRSPPAAVGPKPIAGPFADFFLDLRNILLGIGQKIGLEVPGPDQLEKWSIFYFRTTILVAIEERRQHRIFVFKSKHRR